MTRSTEELLFHWSAVVQRATNAWAKDFSASIGKQSRRKGWKPTPKQAALMQQMVSDLFQHSDQGEDDFSLIE